VNSFFSVSVVARTLSRRGGEPLPAEFSVVVAAEGSQVIAKVDYPSWPWYDIAIQMIMKMTRSD
jgi:hypothetical protein